VTTQEFPQPNPITRATRLDLLTRALDKARAAGDQWQRVTQFDQARCDVVVSAVMERTIAALVEARAYLGEPPC
jgi:hypothetical protein